MKRRAATAWLLLPVALAAAAAGQTTQPARGGPLAEIITVDGTSFRGRLEGIDAAGAVLTTPEGTRKVPRRQLWLIRLDRSDELLRRVGQKAIILAREGMLGIERLQVGDGKISVDSALLGRASLDLQAAAVIYLPAAAQRAASLEQRFEEFKLPRAGRDYLIAADKDGNLAPYPGVLKAIASGKATFELNKADRTIDLPSVRVIALAPLPRAVEAPAGVLAGKDGSAVPFTSIRLAGSKLSIAGEGLTAEAADLSAVAQIRFRSDKLVNLADLKPAEVLQAGMFDVAFPFGRNRSAARGPIRLGGATYPHGLGLHSRCELTYDLGGEYVTFAATAGIDAAGGSRGNATLTIFGDGKQLTPEPLKLAGGAQPVPIRCDVTGVKKLTILADYGDDGIDVGDYVDLADARLIRP